MGLGEHRCEACGYIIDGLPEPRCPECGTAFDPQTLLVPVGPVAPLPWLTLGLAIAGTALVLTPLFLARALAGPPARMEAVVLIVPYAIGLGLNVTALWRFGEAYRVRQQDLAWSLLAFACFVACVGLTCGGVCGAFGIVMGGLEFGLP